MDELVGVMEFQTLVPRIFNLQQSFAIFLDQMNGICYCRNRLDGRLSVHETLDVCTRSVSSEQLDSQAMVF